MLSGTLSIYATERATLHFVVERTFFTYILSNRSKTLYTGVTNNMGRMLAEHRTAEGSAFTSRYKIDRLVYFEKYRYVREAIAREKQIKDMHRADKIRLIVSVNPTWKDLSEEWGKAANPMQTRKTRMTFEGEVPNELYRGEE